MMHPAMDNLGYWLALAGRAVTYAFTSELEQACRVHGKPYTITPPQWSLIATLAHEDGLSPSHLCQRLQNDAPTITGIIRRLEQSELVVRRPHEEDRRSVRVWLTDEGRAAMEFLPDCARTVATLVENTLAPDDQPILKGALASLVDRLWELYPDRQL